jgi:Uma2 family endonuclease
MVLSMPIMASPPSEPKLFSLADYLAKEERSAHKYQFFNGQIIRMPGAKSRHNLIATNITFAIKMAARAASKSLLVYNSDQKIIIEQEETVAVVYPDAMVICEKPIFGKI